MPFFTSYRDFILMAQPTNEELQQMDAETLRRQLMTERGERVGAGENRALLKMDPPSLDDHESYTTFARALKIWTKYTSYNDKQQACAVVGMIHDKHKIRKGLKSTMLNTLTDDQVDNLTMKVVTDFLSEQLGQVEQDELHVAYNDFIDCRIKVGESYGEFTARFDGLYRTLTRMDKNTTISDKALAMQVVKAAKLPQTTMVSVFANTVWDDNGKIYENIRAMINRICSGQQKVGEKMASVRLTTEVGDQEVKYDNGAYYIDGEQYISHAQHQILLAGSKDTRGRGRGKGRGRGRGGSRGGRDGAGRGGRTEEADGAEGGDYVCWNCGKEGHRKWDCPDPKKKGGHEGEGFLAHGFYVGDDHVSIGDCHVAEAAVSEVIDDDDGQQEVYVDGSKLTRQTFTDEAEGAAGMDSCCSRTIMGPRWFKAYKKLLPESMKKEMEGPFKSEMSFLFGDGRSLGSCAKWILPLQLHGHKAKVAVELVKSDIPLLLSKTTMAKCAMILDFARNKTTVFGVERNMKETTIGHPIIRVVPYNTDPFMLQGEVLVSELSEVNSSTRYLSKPEMTEQEQRKTIQKVHKQFGHQSAKKFIKFFEQSSIKWKPGLVRDELKKIEKTCHGCQMKRNKPNKPAACIPHADGFNQCVGIDLRIEPGTGNIILYIIDMWSRLMQGCYIPSKQPEHVVAGILDCWVSKYGIFDRTVHDNGGEFIGKAFVEMTDLLGIQDGTTAAHSPFSAGLVEKHHALCDRTLEALRRDFPGYNKRILLNWALAIKNSTPTSTGWSPYQVIYQRNPKLPSSLESDLPGLREEVTSRELMQNLNAIEQARIAYNAALADTQIKKAILCKVRRNPTVFERNDDIYWRAVNNTENWMQGKVLAVDGKILWVRKGSQLYRVSTDMAVKKFGEANKVDKVIKDGRLVQAQQEDQVDKPRRPRFYSMSETDYAPLAEGELETPEEDVTLPEEISQQPPGPRGPPVGVQDEIEEPEQAAREPPDSSDDVFEAPEVSVGEVQQSVHPDTAGVRAMIDTELRERRGSKRKTKAASGQVAKARRVTERIQVKKGEWLEVSKGHDGEKFLCQIAEIAGKAGGKHQNRVNLQPPQGEKFGIDLTDQTYHWRKVDRPAPDQVLYTAPGEECLMEIVPYHMHGNMDCVMAKKEELDKIVNKFNAVEVVPDDGAYKISCRFVLWYKKHSDGSVQTRARLVARGFQEIGDDIPSDSPTMDHSSLKVILGVASAKEWDLGTVDIKSAFLQGLPLTERDVRVIPPPEAQVPSGHVWKLRISLYGLQDASLRFHWKVREVMKTLGLKQSRYDPAVFIDMGKDGVAKGIVGTHVDDFLLAGTKGWRSDLTEKIRQHFQLGKVEESDFLYCGHRITSQAGNIVLSQKEFADEVKPLVIDPARKKQGDSPITDKERSTIRSYAGKLGWLGRTTRPDLLFAQIEASTAVTKATVNDLKKLAKAVSRIPASESVMRVPKLPSDVKEWKLQLFTDAAWKNLGEAGSTAGKVLYISGAGVSYPVYWGAHKLRRVCHSSQTAEIMALNEGLNDSVLIKELIQEFTGVQVEMEAIIDNKNAYGALTSNTAPADKRLKCEVAGAREAIMSGEVKRIKLVSGKKQLADALTKGKADSTDILISVQTGIGISELGF